MALQVALATPDVVYAKRFVEAASSLPAEPFRLVAFTKEATLNQFLQEGSKLDILLLSPLFDRNQIGEGHHDHAHVIYLSEEPVKSDLKAKYISPYQPASVILAQVIAHAGDQTLQDKKLQRLKVQTVFSAAGGSGKTTTAIQWARRCAMKGEQVLYMNLECPSGADVWLSQGQEHLWDELLYFIKEKSERLSMKLPDYLFRDEVWNIMYFPAPANVVTTNHLQADDIAFLLQIVEENGYADRIVLDIGYSSAPLLEAAFVHADLILWILTEDPMARQKEKSMFAEVQKRGWLHQESPVIHFILNRCLSDVAKPNWTNHPGVTEHWSSLPYVPGWKLIQHKAGWDPPASYVNQLDRLIF